MRWPRSTASRLRGSNNFPREVIEWDRDENAYAILGPASAIREEEGEEERRELRVQQMETLVASFDDGPWGRAEAYAVAKEQFGWGQKKIDELLKLAVEREKVDLDVAAHGEHVYTVRS